jgi:hypothetical protein
MIVGLRGTLVPALCASAALLFTSAPGRANACADAQCRYVKMLLHRNQLAIQHQLKYINAQDQWIAKQKALAAEVPTTPQEAARINRQIKAAGIVIQKFNQLLEPAKLKLVAFMVQTNNAIIKLKELAPPGSAYEWCVTSSEETFKKQLEQAQNIINRPPATPFVPSSVSPSFATGEFTHGRTFRRIDHTPGGRGFFRSRRL